MFVVNWIHPINKLILGVLNVNYFRKKAPP